MSDQMQSNGLYHREDGLIEARMAISDLEIRHSGRPDEAFTVRGYPIVFDRVSLDLGGFKEKLDAHAFDEILASDPDVHFVWDHDTRYVGARTKNGTLTLSADEHGVFMDARVGNYSWAKDLRTALERGDITQGSFKFSDSEDGVEWEIQEDESILRTVTKVGGLYDVTVTAQGAYPQTSLAVARSLIEAAKASGRLETGAAPVAEETQGEPESQKGSVEATEEFMRWKEAKIKRAAAHQSTLAKLAGKLGKLE
jgi:HK97 family phage prohead protease